MIRGSAGFHSLVVRVDRLLPCRPVGATRAVGKEVRVRLQHLLVGSSVQHVGHQDVGDGEVFVTARVAPWLPTMRRVTCGCPPTSRVSLLLVSRRPRPCLSREPPRRFSSRRRARKLRRPHHPEAKPATQSLGGLRVQGHSLHGHELTRFGDLIELLGAPLVTTEKGVQL